MPPIPDHSGELVARRYRLQRPIGEGGFGRVYRAVDERLFAPVAVKVIHPWFAADDEWVQRFAAEARTAAGIGHPGVVRVTDTGVDRKIGPYTVAEIVEGGSLRDVLDRGQSLPAHPAAELVAQAADALAAAHARGVVHRDVKPGNLLLDAHGRVRVCDFGIARLQTGATKSSASHTLIGTPAYMSPEQSRGKSVGPSTDQYALGIVLHELLTGRPPFDGENAVAIAMAHISDPPPAPPASTPPHVRDVLARALAKDPADRFPDIAALAAALRDPSADPTVPLTGADAATRKARRARELRAAAREMNTAATVPATGGRRRRLPLAAIAVGVLVLLLAGGAAAVLLGGVGGGDPRATSEASTGTSPDAADVAADADSSSGDAEAAAPPEPTTVDVPSLIGLSKHGARARLGRNGLTFDAVHRESVRQPAGRIVSQRPAAGTTAADGDTVQVTISDGPPPADVPKVAGSPTGAAQAALAQAGLTVGSTQVVASSRPAGTVIRTEPRAGQSVARGSAVTIVVARPKRWRPVDTFEQTADGSTPSFRIPGRKWRITYSTEEISCEYTVIECGPPTLKIEKIGNYGSETVELGSGENTIFGPDGPGRFRLTLSSSGGQWSLTARVEEYS